ncbi:THY1 Predicted alternative thymidylate synthase [uncultured Caudovirales phage]|uniref:THY1 Predicted alternative thymidylate synthase n=1 Tax=uncultured Caudovirales phage TaxID=2100421 RepID=A0A6J5LD67_9CAUD|nr:THY1 Predicted alternative thymidylate synthase [uncultured Caudovirales phage]CAB5222037.1 THY1 Predicted alternative thymidylate synthase [uncultured Caudovirales phage]
MTAVKLIWTTPDGERLVAQMARVSNPENENNTVTAPKLIKYLAKHKHWSPFEMVSACIEIETTRDIARQILRHRSFSFQEFSQRYAEAYMFETGECRLQDNKNRQNSLLNEDRELADEWEHQQQLVLQAAVDAYQWALKNNIAKEVARKVLPEGMTMSRMYMTGNLRSWIHYLSVRLDPSTQKEHREVAQLIKVALEQHYPNLMEYANAVDD